MDHIIFVLLAILHVFLMNRNEFFFCVCVCLKSGLCFIDLSVYLVVLSVAQMLISLWMFHTA